MLRMRRFLSVGVHRLAAPKIGVTKDNLVIVMYHPAAENDVKYEDTMPLPLNKPETAEKLGHQLLKKHNMNDVDIEAHYHSRSYPTPEGYDVQALSDMFPNRPGKTHSRNLMSVPPRLAKIYNNSPRSWSIHRWAFENRSIANRPGKRRRERDPKE